MPPFLLDLLQNHGEVLFIIVFILLPVIRSVFESLAKGKDKGQARERMRERRESRRTAPEESEAPSGEDLWRELLEGPSETPEPVAFDPLMDEVADVGAVELDAPPPVPVVVPSAAPERPKALSDFESVELSGLSDPSEEGYRPLADGTLEGRLEQGAEAPLGDLASFSEHHAADPLSQLGGLTSLAPTPDDATEAPRPRRRVGPAPAGDRRGWARAMVLAEVLGPPVALRGPGSLAPPGLTG